MNNFLKYLPNYLLKHILKDLLEYVLKYILKYFANSLVKYLLKYVLKYFLKYIIAVKPHPQPPYQASSWFYRSSQIVACPSNKRMKEKGWVVHTLDPALHPLWDDKTLIGIAGIHVDDMLSTFSRCEKGKAAWTALKGAFQGGEWQEDKFVYCGKTVAADRKEKKVTINMLVSSKAMRFACLPSEDDSRKG